LNNFSSFYYSFGDPVGCVKLLNDKLFVGCDDGSLVYYKSSSERMDFISKMKSDLPVKSMCLQPNGNDDVIVAGISSNLVGYDTRNGESCYTMKGHTQAVSCLSSNELSNDYRFFHDESISDWYIVSGSFDKTLKLWDLRKQECLQTMRGHTKAVTSVQMRGDRILSGGSFGENGLVRVWNKKSAKQVRTLETGLDKVNCLKFDGCHIVIHFLLIRRVLVEKTN
jgi:WD40 repeat protein